MFCEYTMSLMAPESGKAQTTDATQSPCWMLCAVLHVPRSPRKRRASRRMWQGRASMGLHQLQWVTTDAERVGANPMVAPSLTPTLQTPPTRRACREAKRHTMGLGLDFGLLHGDPRSTSTRHGPKPTPRAFPAPRLDRKSFAPDDDCKHPDSPSSLQPLAGRSSPPNLHEAEAELEACRVASRVERRPPHTSLSRSFKHGDPTGPGGQLGLHRGGARWRDHRSGPSPASLICPVPRTIRIAHGISVQGTQGDWAHAAHLLSMPCGGRRHLRPTAVEQATSTERPAQQSDNPLERVICCAASSSGACSARCCLLPKRAPNASPSHWRPIAASLWHAPALLVAWRALPMPPKRRRLLGYVRRVGLQTGVSFGTDVVLTFRHAF